MIMKRVRRWHLSVLPVQEKTTTILKLASELKRRSDKNILLISIQGHSADKLHRHAKQSRGDDEDCYITPGTWEI
jgi:hypothetical protein